MVKVVKPATMAAEVMMAFVIFAATKQTINREGWGISKQSHNNSAVININSTISGSSLVKLSDVYLLSTLFKHRLISFDAI